MKNFVDRKNAIKKLKEYISKDETLQWVVLAGRKGIGKTEFARKFEQDDSTVLCTPNLSCSFTQSLIKALKFEDEVSLENIVKDFAFKNEYAREILNQVDCNYVNDLKDRQFFDYIDILVSRDIESKQYKFAKHLACKISKNISSIFLDDFHMCDYDSYFWIVEFWRAMDKKLLVVVICNFELQWDSENLYKRVGNYSAPIDIDKFDEPQDYYDILNDNLKFENHNILLNIAETLYKLYDGRSELLFETLKMIDNSNTSMSDDDKRSMILSIATQLHFSHFESMDEIKKSVLKLLAFCPVPITKDNIFDILDLFNYDSIITELYNNKFISIIFDKKTGETKYFIENSILSKIFIESCNSNEKTFYLTKIYYSIQKNSIDVNIEQKLELSITLGEYADSTEYLLEFINSESQIFTNEKKFYYLNKFLNTFSNVPNNIINLNLAKKLYEYGYYKSAIKLMGALIESKKEPSFEELIILGDIQHLLLDPESSKTFRQAEVISNNISDRIIALNRQIMALNQEHQETYAKQLYKESVAKYKDECCKGLVELYRNANNNFGYKEAMEYTIKGYLLAKQINEELEMYKCIHNICMLRLQYGKYDDTFNDDRFINSDIKFENILNYFEQQPKYRHEQAYPLVDLGTLNMFRYVQKHENKYLNLAKKYYSEAQLLARSFYACNIADMGLLIVNSYLYSEDTVFIRKIRANAHYQYTKQKDSIADFRVHRKILLSLALSAIITKDNNEAEQYLSQVYKYIEGAETHRYNNMCKRIECYKYLKEAPTLEGKYELYYACDEFVPWLISFCH